MVKIISCFLLSFGFWHVIQAQGNYLEEIKRPPAIDTELVQIERKLEHLRSSSDTSSFIETSLLLVRVYTTKSRYSKAEKISEDGIKWAILSKNSILEASFYQQLGNLNKFKNDNSTALRMYLKAADILETKGAWDNLVMCYIDMAEFYRKRGAYEDAKNYIRRARKIYQSREINNLKASIRIYNRTAAIYNETGLTDSSIFYSRIALKLSRENKDKNYEAMSLNELGFSFKNLRRVDTAIVCYKEAEQIWFSIGEDKNAVNAMNNRAMLLAHNFYSKKELLPFYFEIINVVKSRNIDYPLDNIFYEIHVSYLILGDTINAYKYYYQYDRAMLANIERANEVEVNNIKEKYENEKIKLKISDVSQELVKSQEVVEQEKRQRLFISISLAITLSFAVIVVYLLMQVRKKNKLLSNKNYEKDILISEIHHRVKNNLQFVSSLINLQINASSNKGEVYSLNDASRRIRAMSLVHEMLYSHSEVEGVLIGQYLTELLDTINDLVNSDNIQIEFDLQIDEMVFDTSKSIALGMITSELISNAIKYAFKKTKNPKISILLRKNETEGNLLFMVKDNGTGFKNENETKKKLGMRLIGIFSKQMKGEYRFENEGGLKYTLIFKL